MVTQELIRDVQSDLKRQRHRLAPLVPRVRLSPNFDTDLASPPSADSAPQMSQAVM